MLDSSEFDLHKPWSASSNIEFQNRMASIGVGVEGVGSWDANGAFPKDSAVVLAGTYRRSVMSYRAWVSLNAMCCCGIRLSIKSTDTGCK